MPRLPGSLRSIVFGALVLAHVALALQGFHELAWKPIEWRQNLVWLALSFGVVLVGRLLLAYLPPGPTGAHDGRGLAETWAASLALGWLGIGLFGIPLARAWAWLADHDERALARTLPAWPALFVVLLALMRWITLPGAMVPRHTVEREGFGALRAPLVLALLVSLVHAAFTSAFVGALAWLALGVELERALARARRAAAGRALFLLAFALLGTPDRARMGETFGLMDELALAAALGCGAAYLVPWLRRADRRAGALAALFFAAPCLLPLEPLALAGPLVLVLASHPRQRRFALAASGVAVLACTVAGFALYGMAGRGRLLLARELVAEALNTSMWGLAWPLLAAALVVGALTFPWRGPAWEPGRIEAPRREALALGGLVALVALALACPSSRVLEPDALLVLFPPAALLAGLLVIPPERATA